MVDDDDEVESIEITKGRWSSSGNATEGRTRANRTPFFSFFVRKLSSMTWGTKEAAPNAVQAI